MKVIIVPVTPFQQNCSILICEKTNEAAIVDPGGDIDHILEAVKKESVTVVKILLTHGHLDHCGATRASGRTGDAQAKTKISAALLAGFLGGIGIHKFYYGSWGWGLMYILFCVTGIALILSVIDFIVLLCMSEKQFDNKYNKQPPSPFKW